VSEEQKPESDDERRRRGLSPRSRPAVEADPPTPVKFSFWLWLAAGVLLVAVIALQFAFKRQYVDLVMRDNHDAKVTRDSVAAGYTQAVWVLLIGAVVLAVLFALFAYKAREGTRSARTALTVLAVLLLLVQVVGRVASLPTLVVTLLALVALMLMYLPSVLPYFPRTGRKP
jgi:hypothetical protein